MPEPVPGPGGEPERSLVGLFMMLASSAVVSLGDAPDPLTGQRRRDLENAADAIDLLALLREKTEGHRSPEETQVLGVALRSPASLRERDEAVRTTTRPGSTV